MNNLLTTDTDKEGKPPPTSNNQQTALEANKESKGLPSEAKKYVELPNIKLGGTVVTPARTLIFIVNKNLKNCASCKDYPLQLELDN